MKPLERVWYQPSLTLFSLLLLPLSYLFLSVVSLRRFFYTLKKKNHFVQPIIVVGNITVGGTGKTPFVIALANFLQAKGFKPGIVSRGVGGKAQRVPQIVSLEDAVAEVGDEAILLKKRTACPVVIGIDRVACVKKLLANTDCDVVISDDGLQHYRLARDIEILLIDRLRHLGNQQLLPAGPLRESVSRLNTVDFVVKDLSLANAELISLKNPTLKMPLQKMRVHAVAAIGNPERFFQDLQAKQLEIIPHRFKDHYLFEKSDFDFQDSLPIVMTEKDAVKCMAFADERFWFLKVDAVIDETILQQVLQKIFLKKQGKQHETVN